MAHEAPTQTCIHTSPNRLGNRRGVFASWAGGAGCVGEGGAVVTPEERFRHAVGVVLRHEGGYVHDPTDYGGETKFGISKRQYPALDIKNLTREEASEVYRRDYWDRYRYGEIADPDVAAKMLDMTVLMGPDDAGRYLQIALNAVGQTVVVDGVVGSKTIAAVNATAAGPVLSALRSLAAMHHYREVERNPSQARFINGWLKRAYT